MTKFSGTVTSETLTDGKIKYSMAIPNFLKKGSTQKPDATWVDLAFSNAELEKNLAELFVKTNNKNPHITITNGQLLTESFLSKEDKRVYKTVLKVFKAEDVKKTVFQKGVNSSFNLVENVYATLLGDTETFGPNKDGVKARIAINHKKYTDIDGNEVKPCFYLSAKMFKVPEDIQDMLKKGVSIKIDKARFNTNIFKRQDGTYSKPFTELIINQFEVVARDVPKTENTDNIVSETTEPTPRVEEPVIEISEDEIPF